ncbi:MAG TPA: class D sortase [Thermoanaerobaculia bacterium]|nr:class D sortase [Thermoanaerobaculia bacterium]
MLWLAGALTLAWVGWGYLDARLYQQRQERLLEEALASPALDGGAATTDGNATAADGGEPIGIPASELASAAPSGPALGVSAPPGSAATHLPSTRTASARVAGDTSTTRPALDALGRIVVPRVGLEVMVADGVDARTLRRAAGHIPGTSRLGSAGNVGIAGHRDSWFRPLKDVRAGDEIVVTTPGAISRYRVEWAEVVLPDDTSALRQTPYPALTLVTCYPFYYVGTAPDRFVVRARLVESRAATAADAARYAPRRGR